MRACDTPPGLQEYLRKYVKETYGVVKQAAYYIGCSEVQIHQALNGRSFPCAALLDDAQIEIKQVIKWSKK
jgi:hypothetical protein